MAESGLTPEQRKEARETIYSSLERTADGQQAYADKLELTGAVQRNLDNLKDEFKPEEAIEE